MKADEINSPLARMYRNHIRTFDKSKYDITKYTNPVLMQCSDEYVEDDNIRVLYIGLNAPKWYVDTETYNTVNGFDMRKVMPLYRKYDSTSDSSCRDFFDLVAVINRNLNGSKTKNFLWTDIYKFNPKKGMLAKPLFSGYDKKELNLDIIEHEIKYSKPDFVFFVTGDERNNGYCDLDTIKGIFGDGTLFIPYKECSQVLAIRSTEKIFPVPMFRIPLARKRNYQIYEEVVSAATLLVLNSHIKYYDKLKEYKSVAV